MYTQEHWQTSYKGLQCPKRFEGTEHEDFAVKRYVTTLNISLMMCFVQPRVWILTVVYS